MVSTVKTIVDGEVIDERIACDVCLGRVSKDKLCYITPPDINKCFSLCPTCYEVAMDGQRCRYLEALFKHYPELRRHYSGNTMTKERRIEIAANALTDSDVDEFAGKEETGLDS